MFKFWGTVCVLDLHITLNLNLKHFRHFYNLQSRKPDLIWQILSMSYIFTPWLYSCQVVNDFTAVLWYKHLMFVKWWANCEDARWDVRGQHRCSATLGRLRLPGGTVFHSGFLAVWCSRRGRTQRTLPKMNFPLSSVLLKCGGPNGRRQCGVGGVMILALNWITNRFCLQIKTQVWSRLCGRAVLWSRFTNGLQNT